MKKTLIILFTLVIFAAIFVGAWWFLMQDQSTPTTTETGEPVERRFNPFGMFFDDSTDTTGSTTVDDTSGFLDVPVAVPKQALVRITDGPVAGVTTLSVTTGTSTKHFVRYVERETGHIYDVSLETLHETRVSNTTIPRVREALFGNNGTSVALKRIQDDGETVETYFGSIADAEGTVSESRLSGMFLPHNILSIALHPTEHRAFYILKTENGGTGYVVSRTGTQNVFSHPFYQWRPSWNGNSVLLTTAPSRSVGGIMFSLNTSSGLLQRLSDETMPALTALPGPDTVLLGSVSQQGLGIFTYDTGTAKLTALSVGTLPEKCVWGDATTLYCALPSNASQNLPDAWYQGSVSFADTFWKTDTETTVTTYLLDPSTVVESGVDAINLSFSQDGEHLTFINKKDGSLWLADLSQLSVPETENAY
ncbi:MAG: hypothetical protein AMXMBFR44_2760 [Candidatus Campbellbacteria bacterium]